MFCKYCGSPVEENQDVCLNCGKNIKENSDHLEDQIGGYNKWLMGFLAFALGSFGVHHFIFKEKKKATIKLILLLGGFLCCGIPSLVSMIWGLIDAIMILTDNYKIDSN